MSEMMADINLPPSLAVRPNIPHERQTLRELHLEHDYWVLRASEAAGPSSAAAAEGFRKVCERWIKRRTGQGPDIGAGDMKV